jgi:outer membrane protein insertion porin family
VKTLLLINATLTLTLTAFTAVGLGQSQQSKSLPWRQSSLPVAVHHDGQSGTLSPQNQVRQGAPPAPRSSYASQQAYAPQASYRVPNQAPQYQQPQNPQPVNQQAQYQQQAPPRNWMYRGQNGGPTYGPTNQQPPPPGGPSDPRVAAAMPTINFPNQGLMQAPSQLPESQLPPPNPLPPVFAYPPGTINPANLPPNYADIDIIAQEAQTGRFMIGAAVNSDAGVTGQIVVDERNFNIWRPPTSMADIFEGRAWRGAGQTFRVEAAPGSEVQRYVLSFGEPYLFNTPVSMRLSAYLRDRQFSEYDENRVGGRLAFGYRLSPDLSVSLGMTAERVRITDPVTGTVDELNRSVGDHELFSGKFTVTHDTRDNAFLPSQGHLLEMSYEQVFGSFDYPRGDIEFNKYWLAYARPDGSGRHVIASSHRVGFSGGDTPIFNNYFAGGYSTMRGFDFRGASPEDGGIKVGGEFQFLGSLEYLFPLTADDMIYGVVFCDYGTVERSIEFNEDNFRVAPGFGLRVTVPALGPAPLAFDFAVPVARADGDDIRNFSFFIGLAR